MTMTTRTSTPIAILMTSAWLALSASSFAQGKPADPDVKASALFTKGETAYEHKDYEGARKAYAEAWALKKSFDIAGNLGSTEAVLGRTRDAAEHLSYALRLFPPTGDPGAKRSLEDQLKKQSARLGRITIAAVVDDLSPSQASRVHATVNGVAVAPTVNGAHPPPGTTPENTLLEIAYVDPGEAKVRVWVDGGGYADSDDTVNAKAGEDVKHQTHLAKAGPSGVGVAIGAAASGALIATGLTLFFLGQGAKSDAQAIKDDLIANGHASACPGVGTPYQTSCADLRSKLDSASGKQTAAAGLLIGGGAVGLATLGYWLFAPRGGHAESARTTVLPLVGFKSGGLSVQGNF
jgi:tetratricopeptide (TPR) repeat protein